MNIFLLLLSIGLYATYGPFALGLLVLDAVATFLCAKFLLKKRWLFYVGIAINALPLLFFRLVVLTPLSLTAPLGISYYTLQNISYLTDVRKKKYPPQTSLLRYGLYITYFPHLYIGPIERYDAMAQTLFVQRRLSLDALCAGGIRVLFGLLKKLVIAARAGMLVQAAAEHAYGAYALLAMVCYSIQLYCDFSGGTDIVLGVSKMLGIRMSENFDSPYFSQTVREFWRRWHITLGAWLRDYIYIPLGGSRKGAFRKACNTILTFLASGLWHGVNYLFWGVLHGLLVLLGDRTKTRFKTLNRLIVFAAVTLLWAFFIWPDAKSALLSMVSVFYIYNYASLFAELPQMGLTAGDGIVLSVFLILLVVFDAKRTQFLNKLSAFSAVSRTAIFCGLALIVLVFGVYGIGFDVQAFIYSKF